jgi:hypothetical protein
MRRGSMLLLLFLSFSIILHAQRKVLFNGSYENIAVANFFEQLEKQSPYYFYYDPKQFDSVTINVTAKDDALEDLLIRAFQNTDIRFAVDNENRVFITRKVQLITSLPQSFFAGVPPQEKQQQTENNIIAVAETKITNKNTAENKVYEVGIRSASGKAGNAIITGHIINDRSGEPVINASVFIDKLNIGAVTDQYGYYRLSLPLGRYLLNVQSIGMKDSKYQVIINGDGKLDIDLKEQVAVLKEVIVSAQKLSNINRVQLGVERLNIDAIRRIPTVFGEADVMRVVLTLPGVKTVGEASSGFNVRGGSADQNLVLLNDATIYNPSHFFGLFSAFNPEIIKSIELYKSSIPAKYGGRLSSVLDVGLREGNKKEITGLAGIGVVTSRFNIEGPIAKDKTSFILGGRSTYANWLLKLLPSPYKESKANFNDGNLTINHRMNARNDFYITGYFSNDNFNLASDTTYAYNNRNVNLKWKHNFGSKLIAYFTTGYDRYQYNVHSYKNKVNAYDLDFDINQFSLKGDFSYALHQDHSLDFGFSGIRYTLHPGSFLPKGDSSLVLPDIVPTEQALETGIYLSDRFNISNELSLVAGLRYSMYNYLGPQNINYYAKGLPRDQGNLVESRNFGAGKFINTYGGPEIRASLRYAATETFSIKAGYNTVRQYIHMLSNTTAIAPTDICKLSDPNIKPQQGDQVSLGLYKNLKSNTIETSAEVYYKKIRDYLDYKPGAKLVLNHNIETDVINTEGKAYGAELMIKKTVGKLNGWISYTYSRVLLRMNDSTISTPVNGGKWYPANYDKPHELTTVANFKVNHRFSLTFNVTYSTGRPITLPVGLFYYAGSQRVLYSERNAYRIPDYFRTDFSMNIDGNHKVKQKTHNSWTIGVYNITGRRNPYSVYYTSENGYVKGYKLSIFGSAIPFVNYNIKF